MMKLQSIPSPQMRGDGTRLFTWNGVIGPGTTLIVQDVKLRGKTGSMLKLVSARAASPNESAHGIPQSDQGNQVPINVGQRHTPGPQEISPQPRGTNEHTNSEGPSQINQEIASLEAKIKKDFEAYKKFPRRKFIGARTQESRFAQYIENWRIKLERIGSANYPEEARQNKINGSVQLTVSIRPDGSVDNIEVNRSSGQRILDEAAVRIVKLASPFDPFPDDIRRDTDILSITRTWHFTHTGKSENNDGETASSDIATGDSHIQSKP